MIGSIKACPLIGLGVAGMLLFSPDLRAQQPFPTPSRLIFPPLIEAASIESPATPPSGKQNDRALQSVPTEIYSHGNPTAEEQYMLEMINRARANPAAEGEWIASLNDPEINSAFEYFQVNRQKLKTDFAAYPARPPLAFNSMLIASARGHSNDMNEHNFQDHTGSNGSQFYERMANEGYSGGTFSGENIAAYSSSTLYGHVGLIVDWGVESLGHRKNILNFESQIFTEIGIGIVYNGQQIPHVGPYVITQNFGNRSKPFLVGVVYHDKNSNNFYDPGEGLAGVTVMPSSGQYYAITSESGGYAIPCPASGSWTVTASGGALTEPITKNVSFNNVNVKLDFLPNLPVLPARVALEQPADAAKIVDADIDLSWQSMDEATMYHVQVSSSPTFAAGALLLNDSAVTGTSRQISGLLNLNTYYWRVRAKNEVGWGEFSDHRSFSLAVTPAATVLTSPAQGAQIPGGIVVFSWKPGASDVDRYWLELATDPQMQNIVLRDSLLYTTQREVTEMANDATYYWRVKATNGAGWGQFSDTWSFSTSTSGVDRGEAGRTFHLSANMPNPFTEATTISFDLARSEEITLSVLNGLGQEIAVIATGRYDAGHHEVRWNAEGTAGGAYYYRLRAGGVTETRGMNLVR